MERFPELGELPHLLGRLRVERGISQLQLADEAGVKASVVWRAENGADARLSTWIRLFSGLGARVRVEVMDTAEDVPDYLAEEAERRRERRIRGRDH